MLPLRPPPPNMTTFEFQVSGNATRNWMSGAVVSTGEILPVTRQYGPTARAPVPDAATPDAAVTTAPAVGRPIDAAGIALPARSEQASGVAVAGGVEPPPSSPPPPQPARAATKRKVAPIR